MRSFRQLIEQQIAKSRASGGLSGLQGEGKPLPPRRAETDAEAATSAGYRIMAEAGVVPEEFALKEKLKQARQAFTAATTEATRTEASRQIADLELRYNIAVEARRKFMR
ncbi:DnaJ family domain-containing protein [Sulfitobacter aestuariivivens]|uniref:DUF1992 domain-containing protein n=1 Tax=Sulfitobacter aestuariivivens TaxID=2766981 RepID=A0A927D1V0_9RHOB|nr:DnaJ family domain-containing protein [Sulfitobacter aestuariivivens]MBD3662803.1 DUF1992 domain-containing protein [Sulfitobacter aestuariivivens]